MEDSGAHYISNKLEQKSTESIKTLENIHCCVQMKILTHFSNLAKWQKSYNPHIQREQNSPWLTLASKNINIYMFFRFSKPLSSGQRSWLMMI